MINYVEEYWSLLKKKEINPKSIIKYKKITLNKIFINRCGYFQAHLL